jgi:hypothetical protein
MRLQDLVNNSIHRAGRYEPYPPYESFNPDEWRTFLPIRVIDYEPHNPPNYRVYWRRGLLGRRQQHLSYDQLMSRMPAGASRRLVRLLPLRGIRNIHAVMLYGQKWNNV